MTLWLLLWNRRLTENAALFSLSREKVLSKAIPSGNCSGYADFAASAVHADEKTAHFFAPGIIIATDINKHEGEASESPPGGGARETCRLASFSWRKKCGQLWCIEERV